MENKKFDWNLLIRCMKNLAEHRELSFTEMSESLRGLGWNMSIQDVARNIPKPNVVNNVVDGIRYGDYFTGANILANVITRPENYSFIQEKFLNNDGHCSIYEYIRVVTKDHDYTLENLKNGYKRGM